MCIYIHTYIYTVYVYFLLNSSTSCSTIEQTLMASKELALPKDYPTLVYIHMYAQTFKPVFMHLGVSVLKFCHMSVCQTLPKYYLLKHKSFQPALLGFTHKALKVSQTE